MYVNSNIYVSHMKRNVGRWYRHGTAALGPELPHMEIAPCAQSDR